MPILTEEEMVKISEAASGDLHCPEDAPVNCTTCEGVHDDLMF